MAKIKNDKYYTSSDLAKYCVNKVKEIIGNNITEYIEPSAGNGVFLDYLDKTYLAYDIEPEDLRIKKQDFLELDIPYKKGRCIIGNPPFGRANSLIKRFYKISISICDYIAFILPISQLNNNNELFQFDLIYSEDLGKRMYSDRELHCCFNIYKRPIYKKHKPKNEFKDFKIIGWRKAKETKCDLYYCCYGANTGKVVEQNNSYININGIINNIKLKEKIINEFKNADWKKEYNMISTPNLLQWQVYKYLKEKIPELN